MWFLWLSVNGPHTAGAYGGVGGCGGAGRWRMPTRPWRRLREVAGGDGPSGAYGPGSSVHAFIIPVADKSNFTLEISLYW